MDQATGIGTALRTTRERRQLSLDSISRATMIRRDYLELIDADELHRLPAGAYAKGFIRAYASQLGLDPAPFVHTYEQRCGRPAPELSSVVRHPVRVPRATQPRTWRMAAGAGIAVLLLLGVIGVVRSGDTPAAPPVHNATELGVVAPSHGETAEPPGNPAGAVIRIDVIGSDVWIEGAPDGTVEYSGVLAKGERRLFRGQDFVRLAVGNASAVRLRVNGQDVGTPPGTTFRTTVTPRTRGMPPPEAEAAPPR